MNREAPLLDASEVLREAHPVTAAIIFNAAAVIVGSIVIASLISVFVLKEGLSPRALLGIVFAMVGVHLTLTG